MKTIVNVEDESICFRLQGPSHASNLVVMSEILEGPEKRGDFPERLHTASSAVNVSNEVEGDISSPNERMEVILTEVYPEGEIGKISPEECHDHLVGNQFGKLSRETWKTAVSHLHQNILTFVLPFE